MTYQPIYRYKVIVRDKRGEWHEIGRYTTKRMARTALPGACGSKYTEAKLVPICPTKGGRK